MSLWYASFPRLGITADTKVKLRIYWGASKQSLNTMETLPWINLVFAYRGWGSRFRVPLLRFFAGANQAQETNCCGMIRLVELTESEKSETTAKKENIQKVLIFISHDIDSSLQINDSQWLDSLWLDFDLTWPRHDSTFTWLWDSTLTSKACYSTRQIQNYYITASRFQIYF